jgi:hypothetical protein
LAARVCQRRSILDFGSKGLPRVSILDIGGKRLVRRITVQDYEFEDIVTGAFTKKNYRSIIYKASQGKDSPSSTK